MSIQFSGCGGCFTPSPEDFFVDEIPLYEPSGSGEHLYVRIQKRELTTRDVIQRIGSVLGVPEKSVGYAGLKDKMATTQQTVSIQGVNEDQVRHLEGDGLTVLWAKKHTNKLRVGHLGGNHFRVVLRDVGDDAHAKASEALKQLAEHGLPNFYGVQRFGRGGGNAEDGKRLLLNWPPKRKGRWRAKFLISALQSRVFNDYLETRLSRGYGWTVHEGDVLKKTDSGGVFVCMEPSVDQKRHDDFDISITGPIFGGKMQKPSSGSESESWEIEALANFDLTPEHFTPLGKQGPGTRRPIRVPIGTPSVNREGAGLVCTFQLPAGSYATVLIDRVINGTD